MKRLFSGIVLSLLLVFTMSATVFAANSSSSQSQQEKWAEEQNKKVTNVTATAAGKIVNITQKPVSTSKIPDINQAVATENKTQGSEGTIMGMVDLSVPEGTDKSGGIHLSMKIDGVVKGDNVYVLHQCKDGSWERQKATVDSNGNVSFTLSSFSPVVFVRYPAQSSGGSSSGSYPSGGGGSYPSGGGSTVTPPPTNPPATNPPVTDPNPGTGDNGSTQTPDSPDDGDDDWDNDDSDNDDFDYDDDDDDSEEPADDRYDDGYRDGYSDASKDREHPKKSQTETRKRIQQQKKQYKGKVQDGVVISPKTGASVPALPFVVFFAAAGLMVCVRKAKAGEEK